MRIPASILIVVLAASASHAQIAPDPFQQDSSAFSDAAKVSNIAGVELLSDSEGTDFGHFLAQWRRITDAAWHATDQAAASSSTGEPGALVIRFRILPDGKIADGSMVLEERSGNPARDKAAWQAIADSHYPPLPDEFHGPYLELRVHFQAADRPAK